LRLADSVGKKILSAALNNDIEKVKELISLSADEGGLILPRLLTTDKQGNSALHMAVYGRSQEVVDYLLSKGMTGQDKNKKGQSAKDIAIAKGFEEITEVFEKHEKTKS
jgi:ankyrin repeat protein